MTQIPRAAKGGICPFHRADMSKVCHTCPLWVQVRGTDPTGKEVDEWRCSFSWLPTLLIETAQQTRQTGAAIESFRNVTVEMNSVAMRSALPPANGRGAPKGIIDARAAGD